MSTEIGVATAERTTLRVMARGSDPWLAVMAFGRMLATVAEAEALLVMDRGAEVDVWTVVNRSSPQSRRRLADQQWNLMQVFPDLDMDFHILDRRDEPLDRLVRPNEYDMFIRLRANAYS